MAPHIESVNFNILAVVVSLVVLAVITSSEAKMTAEDLKAIEAVQVREMLKHQLKEEEKDQRRRGQQIVANDTVPQDKYAHPYMVKGIVNDVLKSYSRYREMILVPTGRFWMGTNDPQSKTGEYPMKEIKVDSFYMDANPVINAEYWAYKKVKKFVRTDSEKKGWSWVVDMFLSNETRQYYSMPGARGWAAVKRANWDTPEGPDSTLDGRWKHPVVHVSWYDAKMFCQYHGKRLPSEAEWEYAIKIGVTSHAYPWGDKWERRRANVWQGKWPNENKKIDGYSITSPVDAFRAQNLIGFYDMLGNVWEWTNSAYVERAVQPHLQSNMVVLKGGSYVDTVSGDYNYVVRNGQRMGQKQDYSAANVGFRCCKDLRDFDEESPIKKPTPPPEASRKKIRKYFRKKRDEL